MEKYRVIKVKPGIVRWKNSIIDLRKINDDVAERLYKQGCPYLEPVVKQKAESKDKK